MPSLTPLPLPLSFAQTVMLHTNNFSGSIQFELPASLLVFDLFGNANIT
jgi:hypothetical protein